MKETGLVSIPLSGFARDVYTVVLAWRMIRSECCDSC